MTLERECGAFNNPCQSGLLSLEQDPWTGLRVCFELLGNKRDSTKNVRAYIVVVGDDLH